MKRYSLFIVAVEFLEFLAPIENRKSKEYSMDFNECKAFFCIFTFNFCKNSSTVIGGGCKIGAVDDAPSEIG